MTPAQQATIATLKAQGFELIIDAKEIVRMTRFGDRRVIFEDGSQKRGYHVDMRGYRAQGVGV